MKNAKELFGTAFSGAGALTAHIVLSWPVLSDVASYVAIASGIAVICQVIHSWNDHNKK